MAVAENRSLTKTLLGYKSACPAQKSVSSTSRVVVISPDDVLVQKRNSKDDDGVVTGVIPD